MRTITNWSDTIKCFDEKVYKGERNVIYFSHDMEEDPDASSVKMWSSKSGSASAPIATYMLTNSGEAVIDLTDYIRAYPTITAIYLQCDADNTTTISVNVVGLIRPIAALTPECVSGAVIMPPTMMIEPIGGADNIVEAYTFGNNFKVKGESVSAETPTSINVEDAGSFTIARQAVGRYVLVKTINVRSQVCGHQYCAIRWESATGVTRCATWEIKGITRASQGNISLLQADGQYNTIKGGLASFIAYLTDLDQYDTWYYSDIINSSKVEVLLEGESEWQRVDVTTSSVTIPDGNAGEYNTLEVNLNFNEYDAVGM